MVGEARARQLVAEAAAAIGVSPDDEDAIPQIVDRIAATRGGVGATVRLLRARARKSQTRMPAVRAPEPDAPSDTGPRPIRVHPNLGRLVALLSDGLGLERAADLVGDRIVSLGLDGARIGRADALVILESLAKEEGVVAMAASFAKVRAHLELTD